MSSWPIRRVSALVCAPVPENRGLVVARIEHDQAALLHEGIHLGERRVRERLHVLAHRPIQDREEGKLVLIDIDAHRIGRLERGARAQHLAQPAQAFLAGAIDFGIAGDDVSEMGLQRGLQREIGGRGGRRRGPGFRSRCRSVLRRGAMAGCRQERQREQDGAGRGGAAAEPHPAAQHQHGKDIDDEQSDGGEIEPGLERHWLLHGVAADRARSLDVAERLEHGLGGDEVEGARRTRGTVIAGRMIGARNQRVELVGSDGRRAQRRRSRAGRSRRASGAAVARWWKQPAR